MRFIDPASLPSFQTGYPLRPFKMSHELKSHPLLEIEALVGLANKLPATQLECNLGDISVDQRDPSQTPVGDLSIEETLRQIEKSGSWIALRNIETDAAYKDLLGECLKDLLPLAEMKTGPAVRPEGYIFISSPGATTPFHFDPDHNVLMQVRGEKQMHVFPAVDERIVSAPQHEDYHAGAHCNLIYEESFEETATCFSLKPGDALHVPVKAPHWVKNGPNVSISLSITWRSDESDRQRRVYLVNHKLRKMGMNPSLLGEHKLRDQAKDLLGKALGKAGLL